MISRLRPVQASDGSSIEKDIFGNDKPAEPSCRSLSSLPSGKLGKLLVFESGKVKLQIGDILLDVEPGVPCVFRQVIGYAPHAIV